MLNGAFLYVTCLIMASEETAKRFLLGVLEAAMVSATCNDSSHVAVKAVKETWQSNIINFA